MFLLVGLMGVMAVGAVALVAMRMLRGPDDNPETVPSAQSAGLTNGIPSPELPLDPDQEGRVIPLVTIPDDAHCRVAAPIKPVEPDMADEFCYRQFATSAAAIKDQVEPVPPASVVTTPACARSAAKDQANQMLISALSRTDMNPSGEECSNAVSSYPTQVYPPENKAISDPLCHWLMQEHQAQVSDFMAEEDSLMLVYDDTDNPDPTVDLEIDPQDHTRKYVTLNGVRITTVEDAEGLEIGHINLIGQSTLPREMAA